MRPPSSYYAVAQNIPGDSWEGEMERSVCGWVQGSLHLTIQLCRMSTQFQTSSWIKTYLAACHNHPSKNWWGFNWTNTFKARCRRCCHCKRSPRGNSSQNKCNKLSHSCYNWKRIVAHRPLCIYSHGRSILHLRIKRGDLWSSLILWFVRTCLPTNYEINMDMLSKTTIGKTALRVALCQLLH